MLQQNCNIKKENKKKDRDGFDLQNIKRVAMGSLFKFDSLLFF